MSSEKSIFDLYQKFLNGQCSPEEEYVLLAHFEVEGKQSPLAPLIGEQLQKVEAYDLEMMKRIEKVISDSDQGFNHAIQLEKDTVRRIHRFTLYRKVAVAAVLLMMFMGTWYLYQVNTNDSVPVLTAINNIQPGGNKATLTLADGSTVNLSNLQEGIIIGSEDIKYTDGSALFVIQSDSEGSLSSNQANSQMLSLSTPKGGQYQITLPDGTKVWLNAASTLKYPARFTGNERRVELSGEAFFEVAKQLSENSDQQSARNGQNMDLKANSSNLKAKKPFIVTSAGQEVTVLGTHFNINSYPGDQRTKTTLIEGKVRVRDKHNFFNLMPGEQATTIGTETRINSVDVTKYTAWRYGKFSFDGKSFEEVMNEIGRWYDLEISYENEIPDDEIVGDAFRNQNFGLVLRLLDAIEIDYKLDVTSRKLIIKGKKNRI